MKIMQSVEAVVLLMICSLVVVAVVFSTLSVLFPIGKHAQSIHMLETIELHRSLGLLPSRGER